MIQFTKPAERGKMSIDDRCPGFKNDNQTESVFPNVRHV